MKTFKSYKNALELANISSFDNVVWLRDGCWPQRHLLDTYVPRSEPSSPQIMVYHPGPLACSVAGQLARGENQFEPFNATQAAYYLSVDGTRGNASIGDPTLRYYNDGSLLVDFVQGAGIDPEFGGFDRNRNALTRWLLKLHENTSPDWIVFDHAEPGEWVRPRSDAHPWFSAPSKTYGSIRWAYLNYKLMLDIARETLEDHGHNVELCVNCMPAGLYKPSDDGRYDRTVAAMRDTLDYWLRRPIEGISLEFPAPTDDYMGFARGWLDAGRSLFLWLGQSVSETSAWTEFAAGYPETCYVNVLP